MPHIPERKVSFGCNVAKPHNIGVCSRLHKITAPRAFSIHYYRMLKQLVAIMLIYMCAFLKKLNLGTQCFHSLTLQLKIKPFFDTIWTWMRHGYSMFGIVVYHYLINKYLALIGKGSSSSHSLRTQMTKRH